MPEQMDETGPPAIQTFPDRPRSFDFSAISARTSKPFSQPIIQPKLTVNEPGDPYEQEADRVAEAVMMMPAATTGETGQGEPSVQPQSPEEE
jgi:hypothetical protein